MKEGKRKQNEERERVGENNKRKPEIQQIAEVKVDPFHILLIKKLKPRQRK